MKTNLHSKWATDAAAETVDGRDIKIGDVTFRCLRAGGKNYAYKRAMAQYRADGAAALRDNAFTDEDADRGLVKVYADTVVIGWAGVKNQDGQEVPFSKELCAAVLFDCWDLFEELEIRCQIRTTFAPAVVSDE